MHGLGAGNLQRWAAKLHDGQVWRDLRNCACTRQGRRRRGRNAIDVRNPRLHQALLSFAEEAAWQLASDTASGAEVAFEVVEQGRARQTPLYCYRPLTADFIADRAPVLGKLDGYLPALHALGACAGVAAYLEARGIAPPRSERERAQEALYVFLARVFEESTDFVLNADRVRSAYDELEGLVTEGRTEAVAVAVLLGVTLHGRELDLGGGLMLVRGDALPDAPPEAVWPRSGGGAHVLALLRWEAAPGDEDPVGQARVRFRRLLSALRLYGDGAPALGPAAWLRSAGGPWQLAVLGVTGAPRGRCAVAAEQEDELRAFANLVTRRTPSGGELAWALRRFELGCERLDPMDGLTDHLLALRALLEPEGPSSGQLPARLAALCAVPEDRGLLAEQITHAVSVERGHIAGLPVPEPDPDALCEEIQGYLRAILRDVLCGHLDADLRAVADGILTPA
jgi:hypothetical protein